MFLMLLNPLKVIQSSVAMISAQEMTSTNMRREPDLPLNRCAIIHGL